MSLRPGEVFAGYIIERELGSGGMGSVYLARHPRLPRYDALKLLRSELCADPAFVGRFEREAETVARLDHPNIVAVHDRGSQDGQLWISMRFIDGTNAEKAIADHADGMPADRAVRIVGKVAAALDYAHRQHLLHRDVKPANILLAAGDEDDDTERVFLSDFGVAKAIGDAAAHVAALTSTGSVVATLDYASPEQIKGHSLDHRSDIYALGCVLYKLLTGSVPYPGESVAARVYGHLNNPPPRPSVLVPTLPPGLDAVVATAMAKDPDQRFPTCRALAVAANAAVTGGSPRAGVAGAPVGIAVGADPYGEGAPTTVLTPPVDDLPSTTGGWSLTSLGGPWRFASGTQAPPAGPASGSSTTRPEASDGTGGPHPIPVPPPPGAGAARQAPIPSSRPAPPRPPRTRIWLIVAIVAAVVVAAAATYLIVRNAAAPDPGTDTGGGPALTATAERGAPWDQSRSMIVALA